VPQSIFTILTRITVIRVRKPALVHNPTDSVGPESGRCYLFAVLDIKTHDLPEESYELAAQT
jgi:hypothetical protein